MRGPVPLRTVTARTGARTTEVPYDTPAPRRQVTYLCARGHEFTVALHARADVPAAWDCRCGADAALPRAGAAEDPDRRPRAVHGDAPAAPHPPPA